MFLIFETLKNLPEIIVIAKFKFMRFFVTIMTTKMTIIEIITIDEIMKLTLKTIKKNEIENFDLNETKIIMAIIDRNKRYFKIC